MPTFLSLAVELQLKIISEIHLNDIEAFTLCCKAVHLFSEKRLMEQYARKRYFSTIAVGHIDNLTWDEDAQTRGVHPLSILRDLLADPQTWLYTKTLVIGFIEDTNPESFSDQEEAELDDDDLQDTVAQLRLNTRLLSTVSEMYRCLHPERRETDLKEGLRVKQWTMEILSGNMKASASLLVAILPNLQKVRLVEWFRHPFYSPFLSFLDRLLRTALSNKHNLTGIGSFSKLTEVGVHGVEEQCGADYGVFKGFMVLPSMRTIKGQLIDGKRVEPFSESFIGVSNVTSLEFYQSAIDAASFSGTLCAIRGLRKFVYDFWGGATMDEQLWWEPRQIVEALKVYTRKTLGHLELTAYLEREQTAIADFNDIDYKDGEPFIGSLRDFEVLETIRLETMMLYKEIDGTDSLTQEENSLGTSKQDIWETRKEWAGGPDELVEPQRLADILPTSTCRLRLVGGLSNEDATAMLESLPALKEERLPNLSRIFFEDVERSEIDENVVRVCENAGVKMKFWRPYMRN